MTVTLGTFKLMLVERCAGLHVITLFVMFLCICPWKYRFGSRQAVLWIASIPAVILYLNFARILALGWAGAEARRWMSIEAAHFTGSFLYLAGLALCFRLLFLSLKPETDGHKPG
jgi:exosortase/archaeosortase family protein